jgi:hypothetical protein
MANLFSKLIIYLFLFYEEYTKVSIVFWEIIVEIGDTIQYNNRNPIIIQKELNTGVHYV